MHSRRVVQTAQRHTGEDLFDYIDAILSPLAPMPAGGRDRVQSTIARDQTLVQVWTTIDGPERALLAALLLLGLARPLPAGRLKTAILKVCDGALQLLVNQKQSVGSGTVVAQACLRQ